MISIAKEGAIMAQVVGTDGNSGYGMGGHFGVWGDTQDGTGVIGASKNFLGVWGLGATNGILGDGSYGVAGRGSDIGVYAQNTRTTHVAYLATPALAGDFYGDVLVHGRLNQSGGSYLMDHPLDPANKYLRHAGVEAIDMTNLYQGTATLDANGEVVVQLPPWFETLNGNLHYQLTPIGAPAPGLHFAEEVEDNQFKIAGGKPGAKVSWQITGLRQDPWAKAHPIAAEEDKPPAERGTYVHPELYGQPEGRDVRHVRYAAEPKSPIEFEADDGQ
jgi:hypothetical protein